ncbi:hypothetical protein CWB85_16305 [Pseudoalteromonas sp. S1727]|nr:hypothetical protein CWB85_16305 [Pseudoalteromonas sp. S1727]
MVFNLKYSFLIFILLIFGCGSTANLEDDISSSVVAINDSTIEFIGSTNEVNLEKLKELLEKHPKDYKTLEINSGGGDVFAGMEIGKLVKEYHLKVVVKGQCASSCANYIATASHYVLVTKNSIIGWHGSGFQHFYYQPKSHSFFIKVLFFIFGIDENEALAKIIKEWQLAEYEYFRTVTDVDLVITVLDMMPEFKRNAVLFSYDTLTLKRLGLNIEFEGPQKASFKVTDKIYYLDVFYIEEKKLQELSNSFHEKVNKKIASYNYHK